MNLNKDIISMCYDYVKNNDKLKNSEFDLTEVVKSLKLSKEEMDKLQERVGILYIELLQDSRFVYVNGKWALKENYTYAEYNQKINELYNYDSTIYEIEEENKNNLENNLVIENSEHIDSDDLDDDEDDNYYSSDDDSELLLEDIKDSLDDIDIDDDKDHDIE